jgi:hypothetical protein
LLLQFLLQFLLQVLLQFLLQFRFIIQPFTQSRLFHPFALQLYQPFSHHPAVALIQGASAPSADQDAAWEVPLPCSLFPDPLRSLVVFWRMLLLKVLFHHSSVLSLQT